MEQSTNPEIINKLARMGDLLKNISEEDFEKINQLNNIGIASLELLIHFNHPGDTSNASLINPQNFQQNNQKSLPFKESSMDENLENNRQVAINLLELSINKLIPRYFNNSDFMEKEIDKISFQQALHAIKSGLHVFLIEALYPEPV